MNFCITSVRFLNFISGPDRVENEIFINLQKEIFKCSSIEIKRDIVYSIEENATFRFFLQIA